VVACDLDPLAIAACRANAELNDVQLTTRRIFSPKPIALI
jgi:ribosomal protein L11 methylase PrmA